jgi:hypothetical protein
MQINQRRRPQLNWHTCVCVCTRSLCFCVAWGVFAQSKQPLVAFAFALTYLCCCCESLSLSFTCRYRQNGVVLVGVGALSPSAVRNDSRRSAHPGLFFVQFRRLTRWKGKRRDTVAGLNITLALPAPRRLSHSLAGSLSLQIYLFSDGVCLGLIRCRLPLFYSALSRPTPQPHGR